MDTEACDVGMVGLGVMGCNLLLNIADHGYKVAGYDRDSRQVEAIRNNEDSSRIKATDHFEDFIHSLQSPRLIILLVPAGNPVDAVLNQLEPYLKTGDIIVDGGNSHYTDTNRHQENLHPKGISFIGMGVSGGEEGARFGPCLMPGGDKKAYERIQSILKAVAAKVDDVPCVSYIGYGSSGHYVKMVHNGIEYGLMKLISETYDLMKNGLGLSNDELSAVYSKWSQGKIAGFLIEITAQIFKKSDSETGGYLIDLILDESRQKGTGLWTSEDAMKLHVPVPIIDVAVSMRDLSMFRSLRQKLHQVLKGPSLANFKEQTILHNKEAFIEQLFNALYAAMILTYTQGFSLLQVASNVYNYDLHLDEIAKIWRGGCIIRSVLLDKMANVYHETPDLPVLMLDTYFAQELSVVQEDLRAIVSQGAAAGIPIAGFMNALGYYDAYRAERLPDNLVQAQRDFFGAHTYQRTDKQGTFHSNWNEI